MGPGPQGGASSARNSLDLAGEPDVIKRLELGAFFLAIVVMMMAPGSILVSTARRNFLKDDFILRKDNSDG